MTTTQSVRDLVGSPEFEAFMVHWIRDRSPPPEFQDYLMERGYYRAAGAIKWCVECPDRAAYLRMGTTRPFPTQLRGAHEEDLLVWFGGNGFSDSLPWIGENNEHERFPTLAEALFFLLDSYPEDLL